MKINLNPNETVIKQGGANLQCGVETVGGKLYLTDQRLVFRSHSFNVQTGETAVTLDEIGQTSLCWTKFLNILPLAPNSLAVETKNGEEFRFVLFGRKSWKNEIDAITNGAS